jgi:hypothetical protein
METELRKVKRDGREKVKKIRSCASRKQHVAKLATPFSWLFMKTTPAGTTNRHPVIGRFLQKLKKLYAVWLTMSTFSGQ